MIGRKRDLLQAFRHPRGLAFGAVFAGLALATVAAVQLALPGGTALAGHNDVACDESVPAGWSCVPLENKPQSGPGQTGNDEGEVLYKFVDGDTLWVAVRDLAGNLVDQADAQFCLDDDADPYSDPNVGPGNQPHDCTGGSAGAVNVSDGTSGIPNAGPAEPDGGLQYEVRVTGIVEEGTADGLEYAEFNNVDGYTYFVYHINIGQASTQAFFQFTPPPTPTSTPTPPATPAPTATPTPAAATPTPTPSPTVLAAVELPATGGQGDRSASGGLHWLLGIVGATVMGSGVWLALRGARRRA